MREPVSPTSAARRRLIAALGLAPLVAQVASEQGVAQLTAEKLSMAGRVEYTAAGIRVYDAAGRPRVAVGCFDPSP